MVEVLSIEIHSGGYILNYPIPAGAIVSLYAKGGNGGAKGTASSGKGGGGGGGGGACAYSSTVGYILCVGGGGGGNYPGPAGAGGSTAGDSTLASYGVGRNSRPYYITKYGPDGTKNGAGGGGGRSSSPIGIGGAPGDGGSAGGYNNYYGGTGGNGGGGGALFRSADSNHSSTNDYGSFQMPSGTYLGGGNGCYYGGGGGGGYGGGGGGSDSGGGGSSFFHDKFSPPDANGFVSIPASVTGSTISLYTGFGGRDVCHGLGLRGESGTITLKYSCDSKYNTLCQQSTTNNSCGISKYGYYQCDGTCQIVFDPPESFCSLAQSGTWSLIDSVPTYTVDGTPYTPTTSPTGTWSYPSTCPTACGSAASTQTQVCSSGNYYCAKSAETRTCPAVSCGPTTPTISGLYNKNNENLGASVPAYDKSGYRMYAKSTSPSNYNLTYYFEWGIMSANGTINWSGGQWATLPLP